MLSIRQEKATNRTKYFIRIKTLGLCLTILKQELLLLTMRIENEIFFSHIILRMFYEEKQDQKSSDAIDD